VKDYNRQYTFLFIATWSTQYLIHPSWALPVSTVFRAMLYFGFIIYFAASAYVMNSWFHSLGISEPVIAYPGNVLRHLKNNMLLTIICCIALLLHISPITSPIYLVGDEALFLQGGLWIYDYFGPFWHRAVQYSLWIAIIVTILIVIRNMFRSKSNEVLSGAVNRYSKSSFILAVIALFLIVYFILIRDVPYDITILRYPPLQKFLYFLVYSILGINHIGPRFLQLTFYLLSSVYLYRTIHLFYDRDTALFGASIYLFSPVIYAHAHFAELASGVLFFIIVISYYFLRFIAFQDNRGLLLSSFFIGTGFLYKRDIFLMFFICISYLFFYKLKKREWYNLSKYKILLLPLIPIIPWMIIGKFFNWRNAQIGLSPFTSSDTLFGYLFMISSSMSWIVFILIVLSFTYILAFRRDPCSLYFGFLFIAFYFFYTAQYLGQWSRMSMALYPTVALFLARFLTNISHKIRWKHSFKIVFSVLTVYLALLCALPSVSARLTTYRNVKAQYFPNEQAMKWVRDNVEEGERILSLRFKADSFYRDKYGINGNKIENFWYELEKVSTPDKLKQFCKNNGITYIMFPYGPSFLAGPGNKPILDYIRENKHNEFLKTASFSLKENYIFIFKLRESDTL
jgi:hypothetical protein